MPPCRESADDERALVRRYLEQRDERAFESLFLRHNPRLHALARRLLHGSALDAEDLVQEVWQRAAAKLAAFAWRASLGTWLTGILLHCARERLRAHRPTADAPVEWVERLATAPPRPLALDLERALRRLPPRSRVVLVLHDLEGHTHGEISERLGICDGTSKSQLHRARRMLRARLAG